MAHLRVELYLAGLALVVLATWLFLTQASPRGSLPAGVAVALLVLLLGIGMMAGARSIDGGGTRRRIRADTGAPRERHETLTEEMRRF